MALAANERTRDIYEDIAAYPRPQQIPLPELTVEHACRALRMKKTWLSRLALWMLYKPAGLARFYNALPEHLEDMLKLYDLRRSSLQAPIISATLTLQDDARIRDPLDRAVSLLLGAKSFHDDLYNGTLEPDRYRDMPLEMGQYPNLFSTTLTVEDRKSRTFKSTRVDQISVLVKGQIYLLQVGTWESDSVFHDLRSALQSIVVDCETAGDSQPPVGLVTYASQVIQVRGFTRMQQIQQNKDNLDKLKHSFVTLCLDLHEEPTDDAALFLDAHVKHPENRWSWQSLQLVVTGNAKACAICNFSAYLDGNTMMRGAAEICRRAASVKRPTQQDTIRRLDFHRLTWQVNPQLLERARADFQRIKDDQQATFILEDVHRKLFKELDLDAVEVFVIALYMTAVHHTAEPPALHQFLTMSKYRYMDLTTAVVSTPEVVEFFDYVQSDTKDPSRAYDLLKKAIHAQKQACHEERSAFSLTTLCSLFLMSRSGLKKVWSVFVFLFADYMLRKAKYMRGIRRDIVISHPAIYPEISMVGRPGIRLPYVTYFALHYQIFQDRTIITMMPGLRWAVKNEKLVGELRDNIRAIAEIARNAKHNESVEQQSTR